MYIQVHVCVLGGVVERGCYGEKGAQKRGERGAESKFCSFLFPLPSI